MPPWNGPRAKVQIKLSIQRLRTLQEKKLALAKASRREIADLLLKGRVETARLRVEGLIQDDIYVELLEVLELYAEVLQARFNLLEISGTEPDPSISDAVCAIVYAAPRTELKELQVLREILMHKFGRAFALSLQPSDPPPAAVPKRILSKLALFTPEQKLVDAYLGEIAKGYGVAWEPEATEPLDQDESGGKDRERRSEGEGGEGGSREEGALVREEGKEEKESTRMKGDAAEVGSSGSPPPSQAAAAPATATAAAAPLAPAPAQAAQAAPPAYKDKEPTEDEELARRFERLKNLR